MVPFFIHFSLTLPFLEYANSLGLLPKLLWRRAILLSWFCKALGGRGNRLHILVQWRRSIWEIKRKLQQRYFMWPIPAKGQVHEIPQLHTLWCPAQSFIWLHSCIKVTAKLKERTSLANSTDTHDKHRIPIESAIKAETTHTCDPYFKKGNYVAIQMLPGVEPGKSLVSLGRSQRHEITINDVK